jgi:hypothetical protein
MGPACLRQLPFRQLTDQLLWRPRMFDACNIICTIIDRLNMQDHGYNLGHHRIAFGKFVSYEHALRIPLVIMGPYVTTSLHATPLPL